MKGCAIFFGSIAVGLVIGLIVIAVLWEITGNEKVSGSVGTCVWLISSFIIHAYAGVWFTARGGFNEVEIARSKDRFQGKLRTAELRYAIVFSIVSGSMSHEAGAPWYLIAAVTVPLAMLGGFVGFDIKRRYKRLGFF
jgi:hypothetical protein